jgi:hypothetical protein
MMTVLLHKHRALRPVRVEGILRWAVLVGLALGQSAAAQMPPVHWLHAGALPPGAIGSQRQVRGGPLSGYFQPVRIRAPQGARIALAMEGRFLAASGQVVLVGMQVGPVYRLKVTEIPNYPGQEVFPTVEVIDRLYPPPGLGLRYPIPIELTQNELELAADGAFVTRVIYVEDPKQALPLEREPGEEQPWFEARQGDDPLAVADGLGRPVAILRFGGRVPSGPDLNQQFTYGMPPVVMYDEAGQVVDGGASMPQSQISQSSHP